MLLNFNFFQENLILNIMLIVIFILLIIFSAFFSSTETAYSTVNILRLRNFMEEKKHGAKKAVYIAEKFDVTLNTILICNTFVNIVSIVIAFYFMTNITEDLLKSSIITVFFMSLIVLSFGEIIPKQYAKDHPETVSLKNAGLMYAFIKMLTPLTYLFIKAKKSVIKQDKISNPKVTEDDLESIIDVMENEGVIDEDDADLIQSAISLNETTVYDIMTPRVDVIAIEENMTIEEIKQVFFEHQFSRIPVYKEDKDNIIGILSEKDFFTAIIKYNTANISELISKPLYVSEATKVNDLIKEMQKVKKHFAIVADEYGGTSGIVTMEDALEELVGEIYDEYDDVEEENIIKIGENKYLLSTETDLEELFETLELGETPESQFTSVGGFVYGLSSGLPYEGGVVTYKSRYVDNSEDEEKVIIYHLTFTIKKVVNKRIRSVELTVDQVEDKNSEE